MFCLGNCALGPSVLVGASLYGRVDIPVRPCSTAAIDSAAPAPLRVANATPTTGALTRRLRAARRGRRARGRRRGRGARSAAEPGVRVVRNGSRGMLWLEPMVEVDTPQGRVAFGPVTPDDVDGADRRRCCPDGARRTRCASASSTRSRGSPASSGSRSPGSGSSTRDRPRTTRPTAVSPGLRAHARCPGRVVAEVTAPACAVAAVVAGRARAGAGAAFPAPASSGRTVAGRARAGSEVHRVQRRRGRQRHVRRSHADRGRPVHADRGDDRSPATRSARPRATSTSALSIPTRSRRCGRRSLSPSARGLARAVACSGAGSAFELHVRVGAGSYICGEETAMLESLEGKRGVVRAKPPLPAIEGLFGRPTLVNNVLTLATVPMILADGADAYASLGAGRSRGTQVFQLGRQRRPRRHRRDCRSASRSASSSRTTAAAPRPAARSAPSRSAVRSARTSPPDQFDLPMDYEALRRGRRPARARWHRRVRRHGRPGRARPASRWSSAPPSRAASARRAASASTRGVEVIDRIVAGIEARRRTWSARRPVRGDGRRIAVRHGRPDAAAGPQRAGPLPGRLPRRLPGPWTADECRRQVSHEPDRRTQTWVLPRPTATRRTSCADDGRADDRRAAGRRRRGDLGDARRRPRRGRRPEAVRHRFARPVRVVPAVPRRDRRAQGHPGRRAPRRARPG